MRITILGAGGFVGSHLVEHLGDDPQYDILAIDVTDEKLDGILGSNTTFQALDIRADQVALESSIKDADVVIDLVAYANPSLYIETPLEVFDLNFTQNLRVAELCSTHERRLIQYSSAEVYGKASEGSQYSEDETDQVLGPTCKHRWIYAAAKGLLERVLHAQGMEDLLEYTIIRPFNFIGPRIDYLVAPGSMGGPRVFAHFMSALLGDGPLYLVDGGTAHRAFLDIDDASRALRAVLENRDATRNQIFNVGNPANNITIRDLALLMSELYAELTGSPAASELIDVPGEEFYGEGYEDADRLPPDIRKIRQLGWQPSVGLRSSLKRTMRYYLETAGGSRTLGPSEFDEVSEHATAVQAVG